MVQEADGSLLVLRDGLCAASSDSASKLFSCVSGFSISAVIQNTLKKAGCCLFKFLKALLPLGWFSVRRPVRWHCANHRNSHLCALVCIWTLSMLSSVSSRVGGIWAIPDLLRLVPAAPARSMAGAELLPSLAASVSGPC